MEELLGHFSQEACPDLTHQSGSHSPCPITGRPQWVSFADPESHADGRAPCLGDKWAGALGQQTGLCQRVSAHLPFTLWAPLLVSPWALPKDGQTLLLVSRLLWIQGCGSPASNVTVLCAP